MFSSEMLFHKTNKILITLSNIYLLFVLHFVFITGEKKGSASPGVKHDLCPDRHRPWTAPGMPETSASETHSSAPFVVLERKWKCSLGPAAVTKHLLRVGGPLKNDTSGRHPDRC